VTTRHRATYMRHFREYATRNGRYERTVVQIRKRFHRQPEAEAESR
jgi:hypothetical protein